MRDLLRTKVRSAREDRLPYATLAAMSGSRGRRRGRSGKSILKERDTIEVLLLVCQVSLVGGTASFDDKNVGTAKTVTLAGATLAGSAKELHPVLRLRRHCRCHRPPGGRQAR